MSTEDIVEEVRRVRQELIVRYGGLDGWMDHLQELDRARALKAKRRISKKPECATGMSRKRTAKSKR